MWVQKFDTHKNVGSERRANEPQHVISYNVVF